MHFWTFQHLSRNISKDEHLTPKTLEVTIVWSQVRFFFIFAQIRGVLAMNYMNGHLSEWATYLISDFFQVQNSKTCFLLIQCFCLITTNWLSDNIGGSLANMILSLYNIRVLSWFIFVVSKSDHIDLQRDLISLRNWWASYLMTY